jgi:predicted site-specific integrase-resolvase
MVSCRQSGLTEGTAYPQTVYQQSSGEKKKYIYARVSSSKQQQDLQRQVALLHEAYPSFDVIQYVGSGINFKRRGFITLLDNVIGGNVSHVVVAHRDRLTRFGFDMLQHIFDLYEVSLTVLSDDDIKEPATELAKDLLSIVTVFATDAADATDGSEGWLLPKPLVHEENKVQILPLLAEFEESVAGRRKVGGRSV